MDALEPSLIVVVEPLEPETVFRGRARAVEGRRTALAGVMAQTRRMAVLVAAGGSDEAVGAAVGLEAGAVAKLRASPAFRELVAKLTA